MGRRNLVLNVVCFWWGNWCSPHGQEYVEKLARGVARNLSLPYNFICFTDREGLQVDGIEFRKLESPSWMGKLPKITAFNPEHGFEGRVLVLDLDTAVTGSISDIASYSGDFAVRAVYKKPKIADGDTIGFRVGFGVDEIWRPFECKPKQVEQATGGRERWWYRKVVREQKLPLDLWQTLYPGQLFSYKNHCRQGLPEGARLVSFHGVPRPHELNLGWLKEHWA